MGQVDEYPNVADFLSSATPEPWGRIGVLVIYPVPVLAVVAWALWLWWSGLTTAHPSPTWLESIYRFSSLLMLLVVLGTARFMGRRWELFRTGK